MYPPGATKSTRPVKPPAIADVLGLASRAAPHSRLEAIRTLRAAFELRLDEDAAAKPQPRTAVALQHRSSPGHLSAFVHFEFETPLPQGYTEKGTLSFSAVFHLHYLLDKGTSLSDDAINWFAMVN